MDIIKDKYYEVSEFYDWALSISDPRVKDWFLMQSIVPTLVTTIAYIVIVLAGMKFMEKREPVKLGNYLFYYNIALVILNLHIFTQVFYYTTKAGYNYSCQKVVYTDDENELQIAKALWWFYFSKCVEMLDTIFFVLRKKNNQVSFLHVYHHASMFPLWWIGVKWVAGGQSFFGAMINSFIHVVMYGYYGLSALGPHMQKYLWWKRYLTMMQLTQFYIGMIYTLQSLYFDCDFPKWMQYAGFCYGATIIALFLNFYIQTYVRRPARSKIQFVVGITHAAQSLFIQCEFPMWMQWALVFYAFTILCLFLNFYFHAYIKSVRRKAAKKESNGKVKSSEANGHISNDKPATNGHVETKKHK